MQAWVVTVNTWQGDAEGVGVTSVCGVFASEKLANEWVQMNDTKYKDYNVEPFHLVEELNFIR